MSAQPRQDVVDEETDATLLVRAHLRDVDLVEAGIDVLLYRLRGAFRVGAAWNRLRDLLG